MCLYFQEKANIIITLCSIQIMCELKIIVIFLYLVQERIRLDNVVYNKRVTKLRSKNVEYFTDIEVIFFRKILGLGVGWLFYIQMYSIQCVCNGHCYVSTNNLLPNKFNDTIKSPAFNEFK